MTKTHLTEDLNGDGMMDLVTHFEVLNLAPGIFEASLSCSTYTGGDLLKGSDIVHCK